MPGFVVAEVEGGLAGCVPGGLEAFGARRWFGAGALKTEADEEFASGVALPELRCVLSPRTVTE